MTVGCPLMPGVITKNSSGKQVCSLFKRVVEESEHLSYTGPSVRQGLETSEKGEVSESRVKQLTPKSQSTAGYWAVIRSEAKGIRTKFVSLVWLRVNESMCLVTMMELPHGSIPAKHSHTWTDQQRNKNNKSLFSVAPASSGFQELVSKVGN